jgi:hypothetical protein
MVNTEELKVNNGQLLAQQSLTLYEGMLPVFVDKIDNPTINWKGAKMDETLWKQIVSFMKWTYKEYNSEAQLRLYYNEVTNKWGVAVLPQEVGTGMTSREIANADGREEWFAKFDAGLGWREAGTVHHHCSCSAFQSGTDYNDEKNKNGIQITLGGMDSDTSHSFHSRVAFRNVMYKAVPEQWIETSVFEHQGSERVPSSAEAFPEDWKKHLFVRPPVQVTGYASSGYSAYGGRYDYGPKYDTSSASKQPYRAPWEDEDQLAGWDAFIDMNRILCYKLGDLSTFEFRQYLLALKAIIQEVDEMVPKLSPVASCTGLEDGDEAMSIAMNIFDDVLSVINNPAVFEAVCTDTTLNVIYDIGRLYYDELRTNPLAKVEIPEYVKNKKENKDDAVPVPGNSSNDPDYFYY